MKHKHYWTYLRVHAQLKSYDQFAITCSCGLTLSKNCNIQLIPSKSSGLELSQPSKRK